jgi:hypothetical protein
MRKSEFNSWSWLAFPPNFRQAAEYKETRDAVRRTASANFPREAIVDSPWREPMTEEVTYGHADK